MYHIDPRTHPLPYRRLVVGAFQSITCDRSLIGCVPIESPLSLGDHHAMRELPHLDCHCLRSCFRESISRRAPTSDIANSSSPAPRLLLAIEPHFLFFCHNAHIFIRNPHTLFSSSVASSLDCRVRTCLLPDSSHSSGFLPSPFLPNYKAKSSGYRHSTRHIPQIF